MPCPPAPCQAVQGWFWGSAARALPQPPLILPKLINEQQQIVNLIDVLQLEVNIIVIPTRCMVLHTCCMVLPLAPQLLGSLHV